MHETGHPTVPDPLTPDPAPFRVREAFGERQRYAPRIQFRNRGVRPAEGCREFQTQVHWPQGGSAKSPLSNAVLFQSTEPVHPLDSPNLVGFLLFRRLNRFGAEV